MKKDLLIIGGLLVVVLGLLIFGGGFSSMGFVKQKTKLATTSADVTGTISIKSGSLNINAQVASTEAQRKQGLSGKDSMPLNQGMLFVFDQKGNYPFWMKDMKFPLDMIWIDENKKIVYIAQNTLPEPGKQEKDLTRYDPNADAKYVLEINAGIAASNKIRVGDTVGFTL